MGQAFDRDGNILGEAEGATKREVFDKLINEFKDAHEIRIRSLEDSRQAAESECQTALADDDPRMQAFKRYQQTVSYANSKKWLAAGSPTGGDGELWSAFLTGWEAAMIASGGQTTPA